MAEPPLPPPPVMPDAGTPDAEFDETLGRAIDAGRIDPALADADPKLARVFAAHQKLESLFALLRGEPNDPLSLRERARVREGGAAADPQPTHLGRYQVQSTLGAGAFGTVYLARDPELNRDVAIKVSRPNSLSHRERARVREDAIAAEARHAASLNHPQIVAVHDVGREGDRLYIVMHYIRGRTLEHLLREGAVAPTRAAELLATVADALHYAHKLGFVHRDLKPANILLDEQGRPHVADFGLAVSEETQHTLAGQVAGTPAYMSPEQARGETQHLDGRTDIWSLGVIGYELLTGRQPFWHGDVVACLDAVQRRDPKPPRQIDDTVPAELEHIILKCLAKQPTDRYPTARDVAVDLRRWRKSRKGRARRAFDKAKAAFPTVSSAGDTVSTDGARRTSGPRGFDDVGPAIAPKHDEDNDGGKFGSWSNAFRWFACAPAAIAAGVATYFVVLIGNRLSLEFQFLNPDSVFGKMVCLTMGSVWPGFVIVAVASGVAPQHGKTVAVIAAGAILFLSGLVAYNVILDSDWWGAYQLVWINVGSIGAAYAGRDGSG